MSDTPRPAETGSPPTDRPGDLRVAGLTVRYGGALALEDVSLTAGGGEITAVLGHNGAGKSTLLRAIAGLVPAVSGAVTWGGAPVTGSTSHRVKAGIRLVPESGNVFSDLSVVDNLRSGDPWVRGREAARRIERVLTVFPRLAALRERHGGQLSGGQRQMLAVGRALFGRPGLLLLDEPSLGLSPSVAAEALSRVRELASGGEPITVVLAEQNARLALAHADRVHLLEVGRIRSSGTPAELERAVGVGVLA